MPLKLFKNPVEKAEIEFREAYEKGVNLGPEKWSEAVHHFSEAAKHYAEAGDSQKSAECAALVSLFYALTTKSEDAWKACSVAMNQIFNAQLNAGFAINSTSIGQQASVLAYDMATTRTLNGDSRDVARVAMVRDLAQKYMELIGTDLSLWRLLKQEIDPQRRAYYLLGLASLIEANSVADADPKRSVALLSEATTNLEMAAMDPMVLVPNTKTKLENLAKFGKCWFCGREMQGLGFHYFLLPAIITPYGRQRFESSVPHALEQDSVVACESCASSIRNLADVVARGYYDMAIAQMHALEQRLDAKINALQAQINALRGEISSVRTRTG